MDIIYPPANGYTARFMADISGIGQATCYIRPVHRDPDMPTDTEVSNEVTTEMCLGCGTEIPVTQLPEEEPTLMCVCCILFLLFFIYETTTTIIIITIILNDIID